jgi:uncharacterized protein YbjT (DUF2867 family)
MRVLVAGASGAVGRRLVPELVARGHHVVGTSRTPENAARLRAKAKRELGWTLRYPSWREGFRAAYSTTAETRAA